VEVTLERAWELKQALVDFVYDAEGDLATALETYTATHSRSQHPDIAQRDRLVDTFLTAGTVGDSTPLDAFMQSEPGLSAGDRQMLNGWRRAFFGLFTVEQGLGDRLQLMNWLSAKHYSVYPGPETPVDFSKLQPGEILLARIAPLGEETWMFSGPWTLLGRLSKPKLAVAIGNFKQHHKASLYADAPELLEQAWQSVQQYHQSFLDFFGSDEVTLSGYELGKKLAEFQTVLAEQQLAALGTEGMTDLASTMADGVSEDEITAMAEKLGVNPKQAAQVLKGGATNSMVTPKVELPPELKKADQVTVLAHPRWGQTFLPTYHRWATILATPIGQEAPGAEKLVRQYLDDPAITPYVWERLAAQYPAQLEHLLRTVLGRSDFQIATDLHPLLQEFHKPLDPELPEIASVPQHLHDLFQAALAEVSKTAVKEKSKSKATKGFQRV
jgi:hypothetical protein